MNEIAATNELAVALKSFVKERWGANDAIVRIDTMGTWPRLFIEPEDGRCRFMIRCGKPGWRDPKAKIFCIANIRVSPERAGRGSEFLGFLIELLSTTDYTHIEYEECNRACAKFCLKHGFEPHPIFPSTYVASLTALAKFAKASVAR